MYIGLHVKYHLIMSAFNETSTVWIDFRKILEFHENLSTVTRVLPQGWKDLKKLIVALCNFAKTLSDCMGVSKLCTCLFQLFLGRNLTSFKLGF